MKTYEKRVEASLANNNVLKKPYKLILNSLFGRFGMKDIENRSVIVNDSEGYKLSRTKKSIFFNQTRKY
jgi:DNA polymerase type B, organellar and viral